MKLKQLTIGAWVAMGILGLPLMADEKTDQPDEGQAKVQLAILLDTSNSMDGLIEQAKTQLWRIVNTFIDARQNGKVPFVEVALYEYGNSGLVPKEYWIRQIQPLTRDLDKISEELFGLRTNGGAGVLRRGDHAGDRRLEWDPSPDVYKAIFIAGNEPFTQGPVDAPQACRDAIAKGVIVNTIHCGDEATGISSGWKDGAVLADGSFLIIDSDKAVVHIEAPQDAEIVRLNERTQQDLPGLRPGGRRGCRQPGGAGRQRDGERGGRRGGAAGGGQGERELQQRALGPRRRPGREGLRLGGRPRRGSAGGAARTGQRRAATRRSPRCASSGRRSRSRSRNSTTSARSSSTAKMKEAGEGADDTLDAVMARTVREQAVKKGYRVREVRWPKPMEGPAIPSAGSP